MSAMERTPERTPAQRVEALALANTVRMQRAEVKKKLRTGDARAHELIREPPAFLLTFPVHDLLMAIPWFGKSRTGTLMNRVAISSRKTVGGLTPRQRNELAVLLEAEAARFPTRRAA